MALTLSQRLFAHGGVYVASRLANRSISLLLVPLYAHYLGTEGYGAIRVLNYLGLFLAILFSQGLVVAWYRLRFEQDSGEELKIFESTLIWYLLASCLVGLCILTLYGEWIFSKVMPGISFYPLGFLTVLGACFNVFANLYERKLQADQRPIPFSFFSAFRTAFNLILVVIFVAGLHWGVIGKIGADTFSAFLLALLALGLMRPSNPRCFSRNQISRSLWYGLPLLPHSLAATFNEMIGTLLINNKLGTDQAGIYALGLQVAYLAMILALALNQAFSPIFMRTLKDSEKARESGDSSLSQELLKNVGRSSLLQSCIVASLAIFLTAFGREAIAVLTPDEFTESWKVLAPVSASIVSFTLYATFNQTVYYLTGRARWIAVMTLLGATANVTLSIFLIPRISLLGPALAVFASNAILALGTFLLGRGVLPIPYPKGKWLGFLGVVAVSLSALWSIDYGDFPLGLRILLKTMVAVASVIPCFLLSDLAPRHLIRFFFGIRSRLSK